MKEMTNEKRQVIIKIKWNKYKMLFRTFPHYVIDHSELSDKQYSV